MSSDGAAAASGPELAGRLVAILERERHVSRRQLQDVHALPVDERTEAGESLRGLELVRRAGGRIALACAENLSRFRAGDLLWLSDGERIARGLQVVFHDFDPRSGEVHVDLDRFGPGGNGATELLEGLGGGAELVLDRRDLDLTYAVVTAVRAVLERNDFEHARRLLLGEAPPGEARGDAQAAAAAAVGEGLDPSQCEAFVAACTRPFTLVQGPPGAGKTRLAAAVVRAHLAAGQSVLVTAFTHRAVNNLLAAVVGERGAWPVTKVGAAGQAEGLAAAGVRIAPSARQLPPAQGGELVGITSHSATRLLGRAFDLVLVDEAGQVSLPHACALLALGRRHVIVGDHRQLPPLVVAEHGDPLARRSLFEHLHDRYGSHLLRSTYRMNDALCGFPSAAFYGGLLEPAASCRDRRLRLAGDAGPLLGAEPPGLIVPMRHRGARIVAPAEAEFAADLVARAIRAGLPPEEAAVISPHRAHGNRIRALLRERLADVPPASLPVVDTVERLQGGERELIVLSFAASDPEAVLAEAPFLFSPNRLNVSLTRARTKLVILLSEALLEACPRDRSALLGTELLRRAWRHYPRVAVAGASSPVAGAAGASPAGSSRTKRAPPPAAAS